MILGFWTGKVKPAAAAPTPAAVLRRSLLLYVQRRRRWTIGKLLSLTGDAPIPTVEHT